MGVVSRRRTESNSRTSTSGDSEGSVEGQYNFAAVDDEIDVGMFTGDRNSASSYSHDPKLRYLDPALLNRDVPSSSEDGSVGDVIRLENFKPRGSPSPSPKHGATFFADVDVVNGGKRLEDYDLAYATKTQREGLNDLSKGSAGVTESGPSSGDLLDSDPPDWIPPPPSVSKNEPTVYSQVDKNRRTSPDILVGSSAETTKNGPLASGSTSSEDSSEDEDITCRLSAKEMEPPQYAQVDLSKKKNRTTTQDDSEKGSADIAKNAPLTNRSSFYSDDTSEDDDTEWPPPPPPPQRSSYQADDSDWERPLPPEILALPGKRNRVASWARDDTEDSNDFDDFTKI